MIAFGATCLLLATAYLVIRVAELLGKAGEPVRHYLNKRGIAKEAIEEFQLGLSLPSWDALSKHLVTKGYKVDEMVRAGLVVVNGAVNIDTRNSWGNQGRWHDFPLSRMALRTYGGVLIREVELLRKESAR